MLQLLIADTSVPVSSFFDSDNVFNYIYTNKFTKVSAQNCSAHNFYSLIFLSRSSLIAKIILLTNNLPFNFCLHAIPVYSSSLDEGSLEVTVVPISHLRSSLLRLFLR